jgi:thiamine-phosphate pyrophosphorylase
MAHPFYDDRVLNQASLYGILDLGYVQSAQVLKVTQDLIRGGVDLLQLRAKGKAQVEVEAIAAQMLPLCRAARVPLIINDHAAVAVGLRADGLHIGQDDMTVAQARALVGPDLWVGLSTHSPQQADAANAAGADYLGFGPLYATGTKPDYRPIGLQDIAAVHRRIARPIFCIGGVNDQRLPEVLAAGARAVVMVSALLQSTDIAAAVQRAKERVLAHRHSQRAG